MCGWRARKTGITGKQVHHRVFVGAERQFSPVQILQFLDGGVRTLAQIEHLLGKLVEHATRGSESAVFRRSIKKRLTKFQLQAAESPG